MGATAGRDVSEAVRSLADVLGGLRVVFFGRTRRSGASSAVYGSSTRRFLGCDSTSVATMDPSLVPPCEARFVEDPFAESELSRPWNLRLVAYMVVLCRAASMVVIRGISRRVAREVRCP